MSNKNYKTSRKFKCPYCDLKDIRGNLVLHVKNKHEDLIPEGYSSARVVFEAINGKDHGICMICKKPVYEWNSKIDRYYNICSDPRCRAQVRENALKNHIKVYNVPTLLNDAHHQEKMLSHRRISGTYTFTDGGKLSYTGSYEKMALEFMDKVLEIPSTDIQTPGPVLEYEYSGKIHKWITDIYYIPANLIIEIKDGGANPNNRSMTQYREKQTAKETDLIKLGKYNYLRLTNNNFAQLLDIFADMKNEALTTDSPSTKVHINEEVGGLPPHRPPVAYAVPYGHNNIFSGFAYTDDLLDKYITISDDGDIVPMTEGVLHERYECGPILVYDNLDSLEKIKRIHEQIQTGDIHSSFYFIETLSGNSINKFEDLLITECFKYYDKDKEDYICKLIENAVLLQINEDTIDSNIIKVIGNVGICQSPSGYYAVTIGDFYMASEYFSDIEALGRSGVISLMNNIYDKHHSIKDNGGVK